MLGTILRIGDLVGVVVVGLVGVAALDMLEDVEECGLSLRRDSNVLKIWLDETVGRKILVVQSVNVNIALIMT